MNFLCLFSIILLPVMVFSSFPIDEIIRKFSNDGHERFSFENFSTDFRQLLDADDHLSCHKFKDDVAVIKSWHFLVLRDPTSSRYKTTFAKTNERNEVKHLHIYGQKSIPLTLFCLSRLEHLEIIGSTFEGDNDRFPYEIYKLASNLISLTINSMMIKELPDEINHLKNLRTLIIEATPLIKLPDDISGLSSLENLQISRTNIVELPKSIINLKRLKSLVLYRNKNLRSIQSVNGHPNLRRLEVTDCAIEKLPKNLPKIIHFILPKNFIDSLEGIETIGDGTEQSKNFSFEKNRLKFIDNGIGSVKNLTFLNVSDNPLSDLPQEIYKLVFLTHLNLNRTCIDLVNFKMIEQRFKSQSNNINISYWKAKC